jgi:hypothetical protein
VCDLGQKTGLTILQTIRDLQFFYRENLSNYKLMGDRKIRLKAVIALIIMLIGFTIFVVSNFNNSGSLFLIGFILMITAVLLFINVLKSSRRYLFNTLTDYQTLIQNKLSSFEEEILLAYRVDEFEKELKNKQISPEYVQTIIDYLGTRSENIKTKKWFPVSVGAVVFFPLWSEFVGIQLGKDLSNAIGITFVGLIITILVIGTNDILKSFLWSEALQYDQLTRILKIVLTSESFRTPSENES